MNYSIIADYLWYSGHILSGLSVIFSRDNYYLSISFVLFGQFITIISRPISRIKNNISEKIQPEQKNNDIEYII